MASPASFSRSKAVFNLGHDDCIDVLALARIIAAELGLKDVRLETTGGERGWPGDSPLVHLDTKKMKALGWTSRVPIPDGIRATVRFLAGQP